MEHTYDIAALAAAAHTALRPGGSFYVSVPNARRAARQSMEPLDCPPHHVSRWRAEQASWLARQFGFQLIAVEAEPAEISAVAATLETRYRRRGITPGLAKVLRRAVLTQRSYRTLRAHGWLERHGMVGHTLLFSFSRA
jgi:hypothetical protein